LHGLLFDPIVEINTLLQNVFFFCKLINATVSIEALQLQ
jgi:hypothetical protein